MPVAKEGHTGHHVQRREGHFHGGGFIDHTVGEGACHIGHKAVIQFLGRAVSQGQRRVLLAALEGICAEGGHGGAGIGNRLNGLGGKALFTHGLHVGAEGHFHEACILKAAVSNGTQGGRQRRIADVTVVEGLVADAFEALSPADVHQVVGVEGAVANGAQRGGERNIGHQAAAVEGLLFDAFNAFGNGHIHQAVLLQEGLLADALDGHAADGSGNVNAAGTAGIAGDGAGSGVKLEVAFRSSPVDHHSILAAGLDAGQHVLAVSKGSLVGVDLIVGHVDDAIDGEIRKHAIVAVLHENGANTFEGDALHLRQIGESAVDHRDGGRNGQRLNERHVGEAAVLDDDQVTRQRQRGQAGGTVQSAALKHADGVRDGNRGDVIGRLKAHIVQRHDRNAVHLGRDLHMANSLGAAVQLQGAQGFVDLPYQGIFGHGWNAAQQHHDCQQQG